MNRTFLCETLQQRGFPLSIVSFDGPRAGDCYSIEHGPEGWAVYYSERGARVGERAFESESDALRYFFGWIIDDNR